MALFSPNFSPMACFFSELFAPPPPSLICPSTTMDIVGVMVVYCPGYTPPKVTVLSSQIKLAMRGRAGLLFKVMGRQPL